MKKFILYSLTFFTLILSFGTQADSVYQEQTKLRNLDQEISLLQQKLDRDRSRYSLLENELRNSEEIIGRLHQSLDELNNNIAVQSKSLSQLQQQQRHLEQSLKEQQRLLSAQLVNHYVNGQQDYLKMVLNQKNPSTMGRNLVYYQYLHHSRTQLIKDYHRLVKQLLRNEARIKHETKKLQTMANKKENKIDQLKQRSENRDTILANIQQEISNKATQLQRLQRNKQALLNIIQQLQQQEQRNPVTPPPLAFAQLKGQFPWPTKGKVTQNFGTNIENTRLTYTGVLISAPQGQDIYAIYPGRVVFSGWLKGYGLLIIVDHGNGYMSLYGHNQSLYRKVNDRVNAGDLLAKVGNSGGFSRSGLYFEVRFNGQALNPRYWCTNKIKSQWLA